MSEAKPVPLSHVVCRAFWSDDDLIVVDPTTRKLAPRGQYEKDYLRSAEHFIGHLADQGYEIVPAAEITTLRAENERLRDALRNGRTLLIAWQAQHPDDAVLAVCVDNMRAALGGE